MNQDLEHLRLLSIFHYVVAGLASLFALFPLLHLVLGIGLATGGFGEPQTAETRLVGCFFIAFSVAWIACGLALAVCLVLAGRDLALRRRYTFCLVIAAIACAFMPFGTVLGIFTLLVLMRPSVKELFEPGTAGAAEAT